MAVAAGYEFHLTTRRLPQQRRPVDVVVAARASGEPRGQAERPAIERKMRSDGSSAGMNVSDAQLLQA